MEKIDQIPAEGEWARSWASKVSPGFFLSPTFAHCGPDATLLPTGFVEKWANSIRNMTVRPDDVWVITIPKCGTTWTQEMVWLLGNNLDFDRAHQIDLDKRFPYFDSGAYVSPTALRALSILREGNNSDQVTTTSMDKIEAMPSPRFIKSHLPLSLLPRQLLEKGAKIVYVTRNPKDVCVSYFHFSRTTWGYQGTLEEFAKSFITNNVIYAPFWPHVKTFHELHLKNHPNLLFLTYEQMKTDLKSVILKTANFLNKKIDPNGPDMSRLLRHLSFAELSQNPRVNKEELMVALAAVNKVKVATPFMRKGRVGSWREEMSEECAREFDQWIENNKISGFEL